MKRVGGVRYLRMALAAAFLGIACASPTLPLPPPVAPVVTTGTEPDTYVLSSDRGAQPNALILVINRNEALSREQRVAGTFADDQGSWQLHVVAHEGDVLDVTQEADGDKSSSTSVTIP